MGEVTVSRVELLQTVTTGSDGAASGSVVLAPFNMPWLVNLAKAFERIRWIACALEYRPTVGANTDGSIAVGVDWGAKSLTVADGRLTTLGAIDKSGVLACTPSVDTPVWARVPRIVVPAARLQSRAWYELVENVTTVALYDAAPGSLVFYANGAANKTVGELWVSYTVVLSGTRKV